ncbi:tail completion protein gp17 [Erythrobacter sp. Alg231-14]|uniref:tail completion protein gp17 n=1 Tax=Erythrobacter sp. Alg231-14 TaxID=1922225 RepID=UPI000D55CEF9
MENSLRADLIDWLRSDPNLIPINAIEEETPISASAPWLGISASASTDWGTKDRAGREVRIALELESRTDETDADSPLINAIENRVLALPPFQSDFEVASIRFLRARSEERDSNLRGALLEFRFRIFAPQP